jgi:hypothetical protein
MPKESLDYIGKRLTKAIDRLSGMTGPQRKRLYRLPDLMVLEDSNFMLPQVTNVGKPTPREFHAVLDEHALMEGSIGVVLGVFPSAAKARRFSNNLKEAARIVKGGARIDWAFHPGVDVRKLKEITSRSPQVRPRIAQLTEDLPIGTQVHPRLHLAASGPPRGSLRYL